MGDLSHLLVENSSSGISTSRFKKRLIKEGLLEEKCYECGIGPIWNGKALVLQIDHTNGVSNDNRISNLRILCPNCHSQTHTYAGRNNKKPKNKYPCPSCGKERKHYTKALCISCGHRKVPLPSKEELLLQLKEVGSLVGLGRKYGVSDNAIRKWLKKYEIDF